LHLKEIIVSEQPVPDIRRTRLRQWRGEGNKRTLGGRWDKARLAEVLEETSSKKFTLDDLARLVYGSTSQTNRDNVRKHLPGQRSYMLGLMKPFVTHYGPRGGIISIKFYDKDDPNDIEELSIELHRLFRRNELSQGRYLKLRDVLSLPPPTGEQNEQK
jgi:hypothetical protein